MKAGRRRAAFPTMADESPHLQRIGIKENFVVTQVVIIPNHAPATNFQVIDYKAPFDSFRVLKMVTENRRLLSM